jgi:hypothetical protein
MVGTTVTQPIPVRHSRITPGMEYQSVFQKPPVGCPAFRRPMTQIV